MRSIKQVKVLLEKYYDGLTSLEEEKILRKFFATNDVPKDLQADKQLFQNAENSLSTSNAAIEYEMQQAINGFELRKAQKGKAFKTYSVWVAAASVIVAIVATWFITQQSTVNVQMVDTYGDPYIAMQETQRVLALVGSKINVVQNGMKPIEKFKMPVELLQPMNELPKNLQHVMDIKLIDKPRQMPILKHIFESELANENKRK